MAVPVKRVEDAADESIACPASNGDSSVRSFKIRNVYPLIDSITDFKYLFSREHNGSCVGIVCCYRRQSTV